MGTALALLLPLTFSRRQYYVNIRAKKNVRFLEDMDCIGFIIMSPASSLAPGT